MSTELQTLYQELILDHQASPRNFGFIEHATHHANGHNPLCGDTCEVTMHVDETGCVRDVRFRGQGCAISKASASMMTAAIKGKPIADVEELFKQFRDMLTSRDERTSEHEALLGKLHAFYGVRAFPMRVKCATLPWHTMHAALHKQQAQAVTTE